MNKKKITIPILAVLIIFIFVLRFQGKKTPQTAEVAKNPIAVSVRSAGESKILTQENQYPAIVTSDQEAKITAKSTGTIVIAPANIGSKINIGSLLAKIDDNGTLAVGDSGLQSLQVQQSQIASEQAKKSYNLAKDNYDNLKKSSSSTTAQKDAAKAQRDIAKLQYENTQLSLSGSVDNHLITSPISGTITNKAVSMGDSVNIGQLIATVSKTTNVKIQFYVDEDQIKILTRGQKISAIDSNGKTLPLVIRNISMVADSSTKKFLVEAYPEKTAGSLLPGTILSVSFKTTSKPRDENNLILPLSAISVGQNESYVFIVENDIAKKVIVKIVSVNGENAEISSNLSTETQIIIDGNKLISDGEKIAIQ